jgi:hypothetical protein
MRVIWGSLSSEEKVQAVKDGIANGMTSTQIASTIAGATRNAVIGIAHRNQLALPGGHRPKAQDAQGGPKRTKAANANERQPKAPEPIAEPVEADAAKVEPDEVDPPVAEGNVIKEIQNPEPRRPGISILALERTSCRWPLLFSYRKIAPEEMMFCGKKAVDGPYCRECAKDAYEVKASSNRQM